MTKQTKILIGFSAAIVPLCGVLVYGLYRRAGADDEREARSRRAGLIATMSLQEFAWEPSARQAELLAEADKGAADALGQWVRTRRQLRARIAEFKTELAAIAKSTAHSFPRDPDEQLAPEVAGKLTAAVRKARSVGGRAATVNVDGHHVDVTAVVAADLHKLALRANEVEAELARRENAYTAFVDRARRAVRDRETHTAPALIQQLSAEWLARVHGDPIKKKALTTLQRDLSALPDRPKRRKKTADDLDAIIKQLAAVTTHPQLAAMTTAYTRAIGAARAYPSLKPRVEEAWRVLAVAEERTAPKPPLSPQEQKWRLTLEIGKSIAEAAKLTGPKRQSARDDKLTEIRADIRNRLRPVDPLYAEALDKLVIALGQWMSRPPREPQPKAIQKRLKLAWDLSWKRLVDAGGDLNEADKQLKKIYEVVARTRVPPPTKHPMYPKDYKKRIPSPKAVERQRMLKELDNWMDLLKKHVKDVNAVANENRL